LRDIVSGLLFSSSTHVLMNGIPRATIIHRRGLRQGDPLSPMLFIMAMDVLGYLINKAEDEGLLQPISTRTLQHRVSFYAGDVVLFLRTTNEEISITMDILQFFGEASGLRNNVQKNSIFPIQCSDDEKTLVQQLLPSEMSDFKCRYLGLPLSFRKLTRDQLQPIIDRIADQLLGWKADLLTKPGRTISVQFVLAGRLIYLAMAIDLPAWCLKAIDKIRHAFMSEVVKMQKEGIVKWRGVRYADPWNLEA
jgi:hypothetical protein